MPKRGVVYERIVPDLTTLESMCKRKAQEYKVYKDLELRDRALLAFLILTGCRVSEALRIRKAQIKVESEGFAIVENVITGKRPPADSVRPRIPLPRIGGLAPFTGLVLTWLEKIPFTSAYVFPRASRFGIHWDLALSRVSAHRKIYRMTGKYPHYFRAVCETIYGGIFKNPYMLKSFMNLGDLKSTERYVKADWEVMKQQILEYGA